jgi:hypothetical protein
MLLFYSGYDILTMVPRVATNQKQIHAIYLLVWSSGATLATKISQVTSILFTQSTQLEE